MGNQSEIDGVRLTGQSTFTKYTKGHTPNNRVVSPKPTKNLIQYLLEGRRLKEVPLAKLYKARQLYIAHGYTEVAIAQELQVTTDIVRSWIIQFDWKERRNEILYSKFCDLQAIKEKKGKNLDERHDRMAASLEDVVEDMITDHNRENGVKLSSKDIGTLVKAIQSLQVVRRTVHSKPAQKQETTRKIELDTGDNFNNMAAMLSGMFGAIPEVSERIKVVETKQLPAPIEQDSLDIEIKSTVNENR